MPVSAQALFDWHERPGAFDRLTPAWMPVEVRHREGGIRDGARVTIALPMGPVSIPWTLGHTGYQAGEAFRDIQIRGPFRSWEHVHRMEPVSDHASVLDDRITFELPLPPLGGWVAGWYTRAELERLLQWRHALTRNDLARHARFAARGPRTIAITGASGMVGSALVPFLTTGGHRVRTIGRGAASAVRWDPARGALDGAALDGVDAVVHLAGENVGARWTAARRRAIVDSRLQGTRLIAETIARMPRKPEVLVSASAIGIYGVRGDEWLDETSTLGDDFLAEVGKQWEAATAPARDAGVRVVHLRIGIVLAAGGGALGKMLLPFQLGVGGVLGTGRQWMSWISREDLIGAIHHAIQTPALAGAVNAVAPTPVTNREFTKVLGRVLRRPTIAPVPAIALRALFGEMAEGTVLASQRVRPTALEGSGFAFLHRTLEDALRFELGRP
ncbi:MAG: TIGR01777 family oxidoreductase [Gemmatimonadaceae bacterium]|jgi:uncharacterized protein (TIGR01777 family)